MFLLEFVKIIARISLSCCLDLSILIHGFLKKRWTVSCRFPDSSTTTTTLELDPLFFGAFSFNPSVPNQVYLVHIMSLPLN